MAGKKDLWFGLVLALGGAGCSESTVIVNPVPDASVDMGEDGDDADGDGWTADEDCNDDDPDIHPGMPDEGCCPDPGTPDQNCDGIVGPDPAEPIACNCFYDEDGDGYGEGFGPGPDCDDTDPTIHPDAEEICGDGIDQDCDGEDAVCG